MTLVYMDLTLKRNASNFDFTEILSKYVLQVEKHFLVLTAINQSRG